MTTLNQDNDVTVIQHRDKTPSGEVVKSTTIKVRVMIDGRKELVTLLLDRELPIYQTIDSWTLHLWDYKYLKKAFKRKLKELYPERDNAEIDKEVEYIVQIIHITQRRYVHIFKWKEWIYSQIKTQWS